MGTDNDLWLGRGAAYLHFIYVCTSVSARRTMNRVISPAVDGHQVSWASKYDDHDVPIASPKWQPRRWPWGCSEIQHPAVLEAGSHGLGQLRPCTRQEPWHRGLSSRQLLGILCGTLNRNIGGSPRSPRQSLLPHSCYMALYLPRDPFKGPCSNRAQHRSRLAKAGPALTR